ncbi:MAG TPA: rod shape-determining protein MreC [Syntrophomonadaceae bacterium]|nr:rod shape-determining protein MreC [Syntrophomonadaceae bacterium]HPR92459.1 rod shape-determining protein MreC [Syntrophomonadaceae bacterium]
MPGLFKNKVFWLCILVLIITFTLIRATSSEREDITLVERMLREVYAPLQSSVTEMRDYFSGPRSIFSQKADLNEKISEQEEEIAKLNLENQVLREYEAEVKRLRVLFNFSSNNLDKYSLSAARVIARSPDNWLETIIIDKGSVDGIKKDMPVITPKGLVGRIGSVSEHASQVNLITDREIAVGATLQRSRNTSGIVEGMVEGSLLKMINIPYYASVKPNDMVITSGLSEVFPPGIDIGAIYEVTEEPNGLLLSATVIPTVDFNKLEEVLVITDYTPVTEAESVPEEPMAEEE